MNYLLSCSQLRRTVKFLRIIIGTYLWISFNSLDGDTITIVRLSGVPVIPEPDLDSMLRAILERQTVQQDVDGWEAMLNDTRAALVLIITSGPYGSH
jgi:hypothetical protein